MTPHETGSTTTPGDARATAPLTRTFGPQGPTLGDLSDAYLQDYQVRQFRSHSTARGRVAHLTAFFGRAARAAALTTHQIRQYQLARRAVGAATGTINRETSALHRMGTLAVHWGWLVWRQVLLPLNVNYSCRFGRLLVRRRTVRWALLRVLKTQKTKRRERPLGDVHGVR